MRVVLDSNIIVAAYASRGLCSSLFELCLDRYTIITSDFIIQEVAKALHKKLKIPSSAVAAITDFLREYCLVSVYDMLPGPACRDKSDDEILALALGNAVEYIVTGDGDLLVLRKYKKIKIVSPREFWSVVRGGRTE